MRETSDGGIRSRSAMDVRSENIGRARLVIAACLLIYALLAGWRTLTDYDLGWQLATGRWIVQHHQIPSVDVLSYTATGQPWIYPVGGSLILYVTYLWGGYALLTALGAVTCMATVVLLSRRGSIPGMVLCLFVVPLIAARTTPRAEMFSIVLFAGFLCMLWQHHVTGSARLWLLPLMMIAWVNLHLGFVAGLALVAAYVGLEVVECGWPERRQAALTRVRRSWPWLLATVGATLVNPWGGGIYRPVLMLDRTVALHSQFVSEWSKVPLNWTAFSSVISLRDPDGAFYVLLMVAVLVIPAVLWQRDIGAAVMVGTAAVLAARHARWEVFFGIVVVVVGGSVLDEAAAQFAVRSARAGARETGQAPSLPVFARTTMLGAVAISVVAMVSVRCFDLVTDRAYLQGTNTGSFRSGLSWWFPNRAANFLERQQIPGEVFNVYNEGGFVTWRLGPRYRDYVDGRIVPFGAERFQRANELLASAPDSVEWQQEADQYNLRAILVPLGRFDALQFFPLLRQFCASETWLPVYLDETSVVFVRRTPETESLIRSSRIDCATAPLPLEATTERATDAFNRWANAAAVLQALGRHSEAYAATGKALALFPRSAFVHFLRGMLAQQAGNAAEAEAEYQIAAKLQPGAVAPWATLAALYRQQGRFTAAIDAGAHAADLSPRPWAPLLQLGYDCVEAQRPQAALSAFDRAAESVPAESAIAVDNSFFTSLARGRAAAWLALGRLQNAVRYQEEAVRLTPRDAESLRELAALYDRAGRLEDAQQARLRASVLDRAQGLSMQK